MNAFELSARNQQIARQIIADTRIVSIWEGVGATVNLVGSLKSGLLVKNRDIDFHIYTDTLVVADSFRAMAQLAAHPGIKDIQYRNLIDTEEACIEWHAWYEDAEKHTWQLDLIHILKGSTYDGVVEGVTDAIIAKLTPEYRQAILQIKFDTPADVKIQGIEIYRAVLSHGVRTYRQFVEWYSTSPQINTLEWMP